MLTLKPYTLLFNECLWISIIHTGRLYRARWVLPTSDRANYCLRYAFILFPFTASVLLSNFCIKSYFLTSQFAHPYFAKMATKKVNSSSAKHVTAQLPSSSSSSSTSSQVSLFEQIPTKSFQSHKGLWYHIRAVHNIDTPKQKPKEQCKVCSKIISAKHIKTHMQIHTNPKPFSCSVCKKTFSRKTRGKEHLRIHSG